MTIERSQAADLVKQAALALAALLSLLVVVDDVRVLVYGLSYAYHAVNLSAFVFRRTEAVRFALQSSASRAAAFGLLAFVAARSGELTPSPAGWSLLVAGIALHALAVRALGVTRTFYGAELGAVPRARVGSFPYSVFPHPMHAGSVLQFAAIGLLCPALARDFPLLVPGHIALTVLTALVEHFDAHVAPRRFQALVRSFTDEGIRVRIDTLASWAQTCFREHLHRECSKHRYVKTLPADVVRRIDDLRYADEVLRPIRAAFPGSRVTPLPMTDEIYVSRYNYDRGGDQGLFDRHYDGNLRFFPGASVVRSLIYLSADDRLEVVFATSGARANMRTYTYGLLDFHNELHWVDGSYDPDRPPRILLKCNYYVDHWGWAPWRSIGLFLNVAVFYVVKAAMNYSRSPRTPAQKGIGLLCNLFRRLNMVSPAAPVVLMLAALACARALAGPLARLF